MDEKEHISFSLSSSYSPCKSSIAYDKVALKQIPFNSDMCDLVKEAQREKSNSDGEQVSEKK